MPSDEVWLRRLNRARTARHEAERLLEDKSLELWTSNQELSALATSLEQRIAARTRELEIARDQAMQASTQMAMAFAEAEAANLGKDAFLANLTRAIRGPATTILGYAQVLKTASNPIVRDRASQRLHVTVERLLGVVDDVLDVARLDAGEAVLRQKDVELGVLIRDVVEDARERAERRRITLRIELAPSLPSMISTDETRVRHVVSELVDNALTFTPAGEVVVSARGIGSSVEIAVRDTGIGIAEDRIEHAFRPFTQVHDARTRAEGLGLGLDVARRLARFMGGDLLASSTVGVGSTFTLRLPHPDCDATLIRLEGVRVCAVGPQAAAVKQAVRGTLARVSCVDQPSQVPLWLAQEPAKPAIVVLTTDSYQAADLRSLLNRSGWNVNVLDARFTSTPEAMHKLPMELADRMDALESTSNNEVDSSLRKAFQQTLGERAEALQRLDVHDAELRRTVHRLAGTASAFGFPELTRLARLFLASLEEPTCSEQTRRELLEVLRRSTSANLTPA